MINIFHTISTMLESKLCHLIFLRRQPQNTNKEAKKICYRRWVVSFVTGRTQYFKIGRQEQLHGGGRESGDRSAGDIHCKAAQFLFIANARLTLKMNVKIRNTTFATVPFDGKYQPLQKSYLSIFCQL